jgi:4-diphosphocytidyl-2-C-methyl-D-erythritol kinase
VDALILDAPAKLNLRLLVGPARPDGYHAVRTLMVALEGLSDTVTVARAAERSVRCPGIDGPDNLAWRALDALERHAGRPLPVRVAIDKRIPAQAGLGGGSSDAAATLLATATLFDLGASHRDLERVAAEVGSDVPFFIRGGAQWGEGRGETLTPGAAPPFAALVAVPRFGCPTPEVYRAFDRLVPPPPDDGAPPPESAAELAGWVRNDLWPAALALRPRLGRVARDLATTGAVATLLCGSGSGVAAIFPDRGAAGHARGLLAGRPWAALEVARFGDA